MIIQKPIYKHEKPEIWETLVKLFGVDWENTAVAYSDTVYSKYEIPPQTKKHEAIHLRQQGYNNEEAKVWWDKYLTSPQFRYEQELEAMREEYLYFKETVKDRNALNLMLRELARRLSGEMYGSVVTHSEAVKAIKL